MRAAYTPRDTWLKIRDPQIPLVVEERNSPLSQGVTRELLLAAPFTHRIAGSVRDIERELDNTPNALRTDVVQLARRFMSVMNVDAVCVRIEAVTSNACKKLHADFTDLRLITTYAGPGTDILPDTACGDTADCCLERLPTGAIGLFKGRLFGPGHTPSLHRSPPIEGTGERRFVLVIDTPDRGDG